jgi:hypothetical protein
MRPSLQSIAWKLKGPAANTAKKIHNTGVKLLPTNQHASYQLQIHAHQNSFTLKLNIHQMFITIWQMC